MLKKILNKLKQITKGEENTQVETHIISFPKSGRTWLRILIGKALCSQFEIDEELIPDTEKLTTQAGLFSTKFTHEDTAIQCEATFDELETDKSKYKNSKVIFLVRDPRDTIVSFYFQTTKRRGRENFKTIHEFIRDRQFGIKKILRFHKIWHQNRNIPLEFMVVKYEDMHKDPKGSLKRVLAFLGVEKIKDSALEDAVNFGSFSNMREMEENQVFVDKNILTPGNMEDEESYKTRKGKVGGYTEYLNSDDLAYMEKVMAELGCPFYP